MLKKMRLNFMLLILVVSITGCTAISNLSNKNKDFEYIKLGEVKKVNINNTRDKGFKFVVTDESAISDLYDILCTAKPVGEKSTLQPDYIFEFITQDNVTYKFNYVSGLDKKNYGNFYSNDKSYIVSNSIDNDIISSFWNIRRPKDFKTVYYKSLLAAIDNYRKTINKTDDIGIDVEGDLDVSKFILSVDLDEFSNSLTADSYNAKIMDTSDESHNIVMKIKTEGYNTNTLKNEGIYKCTISFLNKKNNSEKPKTYYVLDNYKDSNWDIRINADVKPNDF